MKVRLHLESRDQSVRGVPLPRRPDRPAVRRRGGTRTAARATAAALGDGLCGGAVEPDLWVTLGAARGGGARLPRLPRHRGMRRVGRHRRGRAGRGEVVWHGRPNT